MGAMKKAAEEKATKGKTTGKQDNTKKEPKVKQPTVKDMKAERIEPNPESKRGKVYAYGKSKEGGSVKAIAEEFKCTVSNVSQHLAQIHGICGFGLKRLGDQFWFMGEPTVTWEQQKAVKEAEKKDKAAKAAAKKKAAAEAKKAAKADKTPDKGKDQAPPETNDFL